MLTPADKAILCLLRPLPPRPFTYLSHLWLFHEPPSLRDPKSFHELIHVKKIFDRNPLLTMTADKYAVRDYVAQRVGQQHLIRLLAVVEDPAEIDLTALPNSFVAKASHGSNALLIVRDKRALDWGRSLEMMRAWLGTNWYRFNKEWAYRDIRPRIVVEEFLDNDGYPPDDFKFFVFDGKVRLVQVDVDRFKGDRPQAAAKRWHALADGFSGHRRQLFDETWRPLSVVYSFPRPSILPPKPLHLDEMIRIAQTLGSDFGLARVDLYEHDDRTIFGEITHYPEGGNGRFDPPEFERELGEVLRTGKRFSESYYLTAAKTFAP